MIDGTRTKDTYPAPLSVSLSGRASLWLLVSLATALMIAIFISYTHLKPSLPPSDFHATLGRAFLSGHTYLPIKPTPELLAVKNPYDPAEHWDKNGALWDASLYNGRYYLYFGPVPAALWAAIKYLSGIDLTDPQLVLGFCCIATASLMVLMTRMAVHEGIATRSGLACVFLALTLGTWLPFMLRRPSFYEVAVAGGYCFSALAALLLWQSFRGGSRTNLWLALASLCCGLAVGCRQTHIFNGFLLLAATIFILRTRPPSHRLACLFWIGAPWACCMAGIGAYNYERFGSLLESGWHYQLTMYDFLHPTFSPFDPKRVIPNIYLYLLRPLHFNTPLVFPFLNVEYYSKIPLPFGITAETLEPVYGLFANSPFALWSLFSLYFLIRSHPLEEDTQTLAAGISLYGMAMLTLMLFYFFTTARYCIDFTPWLMFIAGFQYLRVLSMARTRTVFALIIVAGTLMASYGAFTGTMSGYCGQYLCKEEK